MYKPIQRPGTTKLVLILCLFYYLWKIVYDSIRNVIFQGLEPVLIQRTINSLKAILENQFQLFSATKIAFVYV